MKNILQVRSEFRDNGPGTQSLEIAKEMKRRGYCTVFASSGGVLAKEIAKDFKHITVPTLAITERGLAATLTNISRLKEIICDEGIDVIHAHNAAAAYCAYLASKASGRKVLMTHSVRGMEIRKGYGWRNWIYRLYPATFFAVSGFTRDMLIKVGVSPKNIVTTYNGVDSLRFNRSRYDGLEFRKELGVDESVLLIGEIGAFGSSTSVGKGQHILIEAAALLREKHENFHIVLIGDGPTREYCEDLANKLCIEDRVHFMGFRRDIPEIQAALDICVLPSVRGEMFPNALLEAMAMGTPWVASNLAGIPEMSENEKNGLLVIPGNAADLAAKLDLLISDQGLRKTMSDNCYNTVQEKYTISAICDKIEAVYEK